MEDINVLWDEIKLYRNYEQNLEKFLSFGREVVPIISSDFYCYYADIVLLVCKSLPRELLVEFFPQLADFSLSPRYRGRCMELIDSLEGVLSSEQVEAGVRPLLDEGDELEWANLLPSVYHLDESVFRKFMKEGERNSSDSVREVIRDFVEAGW